MRVLIIGDTHLPSAHPSYLRFCRDLRDQHRCDTVVHIGDVLDFQSISFHAHHPELPAPLDEFELAYKALRPWIKAFPEVKVCRGNHDNRVIRLAESVNIPAKFIRDFSSVWDSPGWDWQEEFILDDVHYSHGDGCSGLHPAFTQMQRMLMSVCIGHTHTAAGIHWLANPTRRMFGLSVGCGIDEKSLAFAYGKFFKRRAIISAATIIDGIPQHHVCPIGPNEKYNRSKFKKGS